MLGGEDKGVIADDQLNARGDGAGVAVEDRKDQRRHVEAHALDPRRRPDGSHLEPVPVQGKFGLRSQEFRSEANLSSSSPARRLLVTWLTQGWTAISNPGK